MIKDQIVKLWNNSGKNAPDTIAEVKNLTHNGYDESYDRSLCVFYFKKYVVVICDGGLSIVEKK